MILKCSGQLQCHPDHQEIYSKEGDLTFILCQDCGLIWRSDDSLHLTKNYEEDYFTSKNYRKNRNHKIRKSEMLFRVAMEYKNHIDSMLEVGCSVGNGLEAARKLNMQHLGIDVSQYAVDYCRKIGLNAENKNLEELVQEGIKVDMVTMQHVLEHFEDPFLTLESIGTLLNPEGLLLIIVPNSAYSRAEKKRETHRFYNFEGVGTEHFVYFDYPSLEKVLLAKGFLIMQKNYPIFLHGSFSPRFFFERIIRRSLTLFHADQELIVVARKMG